MARIALVCIKSKPSTFTKAPVSPGEVQVVEVVVVAVVVAGVPSPAPGLERLVEGFHEWTFGVWVGKWVENCVVSGPKVCISEN